MKTSCLVSSIRLSLFPLFIAILGIAFDSPAQSLTDALDAPGQIWTAQGAGLWFGQTAVTHDGVDAVQSPAGLVTGEQSTLSTTVSGPGMLTFWWRKGGDGWQSALICATTDSTNGEQVRRWENTLFEWRQENIFLSASGPITISVKLLMEDTDFGLPESVNVDQFSFGPAAPNVTTGGATNVTSGSATLNGAVNPHGQVTNFQFQHGLTTSYGSSAPVSPASAGNGVSVVNVSANLTGLTAGATYHYRLVATNPTGTTYGIDAAFVAAPGSNNDFANRINLGNASTVAITGDNTGATLEAGEVNPGVMGGGSVWYQWTAPSTGWATIHTVADSSTTALDTVLAVYTGSALGTLEMLGFNDESWRRPDDYPPAVYSTGFGPSRLVFQAVAGTVYQIAVHGYDWDGPGGDPLAVGAFELNIASDPAPAYRVTGLTLTPAAVDVTSGAQSVTVQVSIDTDMPMFDPFGYLETDILKPNGGTDAGERDGLAIGLWGTDRISGTATSGTYEKASVMPRYVPGGSWPVVVWIGGHQEFTSIPWTPAGNDMFEDHYIISAPIGKHLTVTNSGPVDSQGPEVVSVTGLPSSVDISGGDVTFDIDVRITDPQAGFQSGYLYFVEDSPEMAHNGVGEITPAQRISGTAQDGIYRVPVTIGSGWVGGSGTHYPLFFLGDAVWNYSSYTDHPSADPSSSPIPPIGTPLSLTVVSGGGGYPSWESAHFTPAELADPNISGPLADAEKDGITNAVEYALGLGPKTANPTPWEAGIQTVGPDRFQTISFSVSGSFPADATLIVEESPSLEPAATWTTLATKTGSAAWAASNGGVITQGAPSGGRIPIIARSPNAMGGTNSVGFMRLRVQVP